VVESKSSSIQSASFLKTKSQSRIDRSIIEWPHQFEDQLSKKGKETNKGESTQLSLSGKEDGKMQESS
jgi:hypothetical protein